MTASEWVAIGLFFGSIVFGVIGWLLIRVIGNLDKTIDKIDNNQMKMKDDIGLIYEKTLDNENRIVKLETVHNMNGCDTRFAGGRG